MGERTFDEALPARLRAFIYSHRGIERRAHEAADEIEYRRTKERLVIERLKNEMSKCSNSSHGTIRMAALAEAMRMIRDD